MKEPVESSWEQSPRATQDAKAEFTPASFLVVKDQSPPREMLFRALSLVLPKVGTLGDAINDQVSRIPTIC